MFVPEESAVIVPNTPLVTSDARRKPRLFANIRADLRAHRGEWGAQGFWVMVVYRFGRWRYTVRPWFVRKFFSLLYKIAFKFIQIITGIELPCEAEVGRNFTIDHFGGIIVSGFVRIGDNCRIRNGVVIGLRRAGESRAPLIGNNVDIGAGAKVLGPISIGNNVLIGANAVVLCNVPDNCIAVGVPATVKHRKPRKLRKPSRLDEPAPDPGRYAAEAAAAADG